MSIQKQSDYESAEKVRVKKIKAKIKTCFRKNKKFQPNICNG